MIKSNQHPQKKKKKRVTEKSSSNGKTKLEITSYYMYNKGKKSILFKNNKYRIFTYLCKKINTTDGQEEEEYKIVLDYCINRTIKKISQDHEKKT